ncbi:hypothetical protein AAVH_08958 [Aphelenchoides avenae]|nr:hypothetical protein AAVH_08958 [Aphelenchus avenae]
MDVQALEERVREIEELLGLDVADATPTAKDFDIVPLKKRLQDLDLGFLLQIPKEKLTHLQEVHSQIIAVCRCVGGLSTIWLCACIPTRPTL